MSQPLICRQQAKIAAQALRRALTAAGLSDSGSRRSLDIIAALHGTDWNTLSARPTLPLLTAEQAAPALEAALQRYGQRLTTELLHHFKRELLRQPEQNLMLAEYAICAHGILLSRFGTAPFGSSYEAPDAVRPEVTYLLKVERVPGEPLAVQLRVMESGQETLWSGFSVIGSELGLGADYERLGPALLAVLPELLAYNLPSLPVTHQMHREAPGLMPALIQCGFVIRPQSMQGWREPAVVWEQRPHGEAYSGVEIRKGILPHTEAALSELGFSPETMQRLTEHLSALYAFELTVAQGERPGLGMAGALLGGYPELLHALGTEDKEKVAELPRILGETTYTQGLARRAY